MGSPAAALPLFAGCLPGHPDLLPELAHLPSPDLPFFFPPFAAFLFLLVPAFFFPLPFLEASPPAPPPSPPPPAMIAPGHMPGIGGIFGAGAVRAIRCSSLDGSPSNPEGYRVGAR